MDFRSDHGFREPRAALPTELKLTQSQRRRRQRILLAAAAVACDGGYDGVQMRLVAERASVALGTVYHYFPSKEHLLVTLLGEWLETFSDPAAAPVPPNGDCASGRLRHIADRLSAMTGANPQLADAMVRSYLFADARVSIEVANVRKQLATIFAGGRSDIQLTEREKATGYLLADVWTSQVLAMVRGRVTTEQVRARLARAIDLLARSRNDSSYVPPTG
ncbi:hypothetical protein A5686_15430 [Mycobacterium sp. E2479]|nr:hypothetical protein A5686_15430 [Mycobacterium sp. E2479]